MKQLFLAAILASLSAPAWSQLTPSEETAFREPLTDWVRQHYPQLVNAKGLEPRTMVAFVVDSKGRVLDHARGLQPRYTKPTPLVAEVKRMLPKWESTTFEDHGGARYLRWAWEMTSNNTLERTVIRRGCFVLAMDRVLGEAQSAALDGRSNSR
jgi:hypothetical protein